MPTTPSPLRYPGGKTAYADMLSWVIAHNGLSGYGYAEPFAGGAGAAITLLLAGTVKEIWLNDYDSAIYAFWVSICEETNEFLALIDKTPVTISEWKKQKKIYLNKNSNRLALGFATFFLNRCNRAGILAANPIGGLSQTGTDKIYARFKKDKLKAKILAIAGHRNKIHLTNMDAIDFVRFLDKTNAKMLVYFDPPYYEKGELLYLNHYGKADHQILSQHVLGCKKPWLLSYDDVFEVTKIYHGVQLYRRDLRYSISKPSIGRELIISNLKMPSTLQSIGGTKCLV